MSKRRLLYYRLLTVVPYIFFLIAVIFGFLALRSLTLYQSEQTREVGLDNQTYLRVMTCIVNVPAAQRTSEDVDRCWYVVQEDMNRTVKRYQIN